MEQPGLVAAAAELTARASRKLRVSGIVGGTGRAAHATASQGEPGSASRARNICAPYLGNRTQRTKGWLSQSPSSFSAGSHQTCLNSWDKMPTFVPNRDWQAKATAASLSQTLPLPTTDANQCQVLNTSHLISSTLTGKCHYPCFIDKVTKAEEITWINLQRKFMIEDGFKFSVFGL